MSAPDREFLQLHNREQFVPKQICAFVTRQVSKKFKLGDATREKIVFRAFSDVQCQSFQILGNDHAIQVRILQRYDRATVYRDSRSA